MALYICPKCGSTFDYPFRENDGTERYDTCPDCGNPDFEEASQCRGCRRDMEFGKLVAGEYCGDCVDKALGERHLVEAYLSEPDVRENFAEFLAEIQWEPWREEGRMHEKG